jgi:hypothetical protein
MATLFTDSKHMREDLKELLLMSLEKRLDVESVETRVSHADRKVGGNFLSWAFSHEAEITRENIDVRWYEYRLHKVPMPSGDTLDLLVAANRDTPPEILLSLASHNNVGIRLHVAHNRSSPTEAMVLLAEDVAEDVREAVASHSSTSVEILTGLAKDKKSSVRVSVAGHPSTSPEVLSELARDRVRYVRYRAGVNRSTPTEVLTEMVRDPAMRGAVAANPNTPVPILSKLAKDRDPNVKISLLHNKSIPAEIMLLLAADPSPRIKRQVAFAKEDQLRRELGESEANAAISICDSFAPVSETINDMAHTEISP